MRTGRLRARVAVVISDRPDAKALHRARRVGVPACYVNPTQYPTRGRPSRHHPRWRGSAARRWTRGRYESALIRLLRQHRVQLVCLAGFMRIPSPVFVRRFRHRILNVHPALLPAFPGAHAVRDALAWGAKITGVTVHLVDEEVDHGPIILQEAVAIQPGDTPERLLSRIHRVEHRLYPKAIGLVLSGRVKIRGRSVTLR